MTGILLSEQTKMWITKPQLRYRSNTVAQAATVFAPLSVHHFPFGRLPDTCVRPTRQSVLRPNEAYPRHGEVEFVKEDRQIAIRLVTLRGQEPEEWIVVRVLHQ